MTLRAMTRFPSMETSTHSSQLSWQAALGMVRTTGRLDACFKDEVSFAHEAQIEEKSTSDSRSHSEILYCCKFAGLSAAATALGHAAERGDTFVLQAFFGRLSTRRCCPQGSRYSIFRGLTRISRAPLDNWPVFSPGPPTPLRDTSCSLRFGCVYLVWHAA